MSGKRVFLDTNVLVYADDEDAGEKTVVARSLVREALTTGGGVISTQVLKEYYVVATRKLGISEADAHRRIRVLSTLPVVEVRVADIDAAIGLSRLNTISFWDALVVHSASAAGCSELLTEDLNDGQTIGGVRIKNPFAK